MLIETKRLIIRDVKSEGEKAFVEMASDGSLNDIGFDDNCGEWMADWITEAEQFAARNNRGDNGWYSACEVRSGILFVRPTYACQNYNKSVCLYRRYSDIDNQSADL